MALSLSRPRLLREEQHLNNGRGSTSIPTAAASTSRTDGILHARGIRRVHNARQSGLPGIDQPVEVPAGPSWVPSVSGVIELVIAQSGSGRKSITQWAFYCGRFRLSRKIAPIAGSGRHEVPRNPQADALLSSLPNAGRKEKAAEKQSAPDSKSQGRQLNSPPPSAAR